VACPAGTRSAPSSRGRRRSGRLLGPALGACALVDRGLVLQLEALQLLPSRHCSCCPTARHTIAAFAHVDRRRAIGAALTDGDKTNGWQPLPSNASAPPPARMSSSARRGSCWSALSHIRWAEARGRRVPCAGGSGWPTTSTRARSGCSTRSRAVGAGEPAARCSRVPLVAGRRTYAERGRVAESRSGRRSDARRCFQLLRGAGPPLLRRRGCWLACAERWTGHRGGWVPES